MRLTRLIAITMLAAAAHPNVARSQSVPLQDLGLVQGNRLSIAMGSATARVGNAALVRLISVSKDKGQSSSLVFLLACDGTWISTILQSAFRFDASLTPQEMYRYARSEEVAIPLDAVEFIPAAQAELYFAEAVMRRAASICKAAAKEPRNVLVPVAQTNTNDETGTSIAIVLGTMGKAGTTIDVWLRTSHFRLAPILKKDGTPWEYEGNIQTTKEATGKYSMDRRAFDCVARTMATFESADYEVGIPTPTSWSFPRDKLTLTSVVPGSVGEAQLEAACALYGPKAR